MDNLDTRTATAINVIGAAAHEKHITPETETNLKRWLTGDAFASDRQTLVELVEAGDWDTLTAAYWEVIPFGTGGRRGPMGDFGTATVNRRTIAESADGLARYLKQVRDSEGTGPDADGFIGSGVIAHDTRNRSPEFARLTAITLAANGLKVYLFESHRSTPTLSFAVRHLGCDVGVVISASHNPPPDNGFKAYWSSGGQVLAPHDAGIIQCVESADIIPELDFDEAVAAGKIEIIGETIDAAYSEAVRSLSLSDNREITALYTPLHGVGETSVYRVIQDAGFDGVGIFEPQREANGNFPNVPDQFPNPERPEVFAPAVEQAKQTGAELVLASDPDADRLGVSLRDGDDEFVHLTGNQIGVLLVDHVLTKRAPIEAGNYVVQTLVTTPMIAAIANRHGADVVDDLLVGFKYIGQTMDQKGPDGFLFGAEESLGYLSGSYARDKDAAIAALYLLERAADLKAEGKSLLGRLYELYAEFGYHAEGQTSKVCKGPSGRAQILGLLEAFRSDPPTELGGLSLAQVRDYGSHEIRSLPSNDRLGDLPEPQGSLLFFETGSDTDPHIQIAVRPSGTEPKIKFYHFAQAAPTDDVNASKARTDETMRAVQHSLNDWIDRTLAKMEVGG